MYDDFAGPEKALLVLLIEDDALIGELMTEMLRAMGHVVCPVATNEADAVIDAAMHRPDLIMVDVRLGSGSGVTAIAEILRSRFVPHVYMSGNLTQVRRLHPDAVTLQKPFGDAMLAHAIRLAIAGAAPSAPT